jgi:hypothetical protein
MDGLTEGRIVHFVMPDDEHRPAIVVKVWNKETGYVNLQVFTDGKNDIGMFQDSERYSQITREEVGRGIWRCTSIYPDEETKRQGSWHWIEKA